MWTGTRLRMARSLSSSTWETVDSREFDRGPEFPSGRQRSASFLNCGRATRAVGDQILREVESCIVDECGL